MSALPFPRRSTSPQVTHFEQPYMTGDQRARSWRALTADVPFPRRSTSPQSQSFRTPVLEIKPITSTASPGDKVPAQAVRTADEALSASETPSIFGRSNTTGRSRLGGSTRSRQSRSAAISPSNAFSTALRAMALASPSSNASTAIVALLRDPLGRPSGLPLRPALNGRPRCFFAVFSAEGGGLSTASPDVG